MTTTQGYFNAGDYNTECGQHELTFARSSPAITATGSFWQKVDWPFHNVTIPLPLRQVFQSLYITGTVVATTPNSSPFGFRCRVLPGSLRRCLSAVAHVDVNQVIAAIAHSANRMVGTGGFGPIPIGIAPVVPGFGNSVVGFLPHRRRPCIGLRGTSAPNMSGSGNLGAWQFGLL